MNQTAELIAEHNHETVLDHLREIVIERPARRIRDYAQLVWLANFGEPGIRSALRRAVELWGWHITPCAGRTWRTSFGTVRNTHLLYVNGPDKSTHVVDPTESEQARQLREWVERNR